jgi:hypothetical protein
MAPEPSMTEPRPSVLREGVIAGLIGAAVVAVWFLAFDLARGRPLHTPSVLGAAVFAEVVRPEDVAVSAGLILGYTLIHGLVFIAFGVIAAALLELSEREPPLFVAVVILFVAFEAFFLAVVNMLGHWVVGEIVWWAILIANLLAAIAMLWYFFRRHRRLPRTLIGTWGAVLREGVVAGLLGAAIVAVWFLVLDVIQGEPFRTPTLLGLAFLPTPEPTAALLLYTLAHGAAFIGVGVVAAFLISAAERQPVLLFVLLIVFVAVQVVFFGAVVVTASWLIDELTAWAIFVANLLAAGVMLGYFLNGHRALLRRTEEAWADDE